MLDLLISTAIYPAKYEIRRQIKILLTSDVMLPCTYVFITIMYIAMYVSVAYAFLKETFNLYIWNMVH